MAARSGVVFLALAVPLLSCAEGFAAAAQRPQVPEALFGELRWRQIGPFRGGRSLAVTGVPGEPHTFYFGAAAGGVWRSTNAGHDWTPLTDAAPGGQPGPTSIGALAVADSNHSVLWVGAGEACLRGNITEGDGVWRSLDGGKSWANVGLRDSRHIGAIVVHPKDPDTALVAAFGHAFGPGGERGVYRTTDGGKSWQRVLYKDEKTGAIDVVFDPHNPAVVYASLWEAQRGPWSFSSGGPGSGLYRSTDGGATWKLLTGNGLPKGILGRIGVSVSGADASRVYAAIEAEEGGLFRSDEGGDHWTRVNDDQRFRQRAWYFNHVFADPQAADTVYLLNTGLFRSTDGGKTFALLPAPHGDHHGLWIDPQDPRRLINGNDGGATISLDGGKTWTRQDNQPTAQFYHVAVDNGFPYRIYGAQQDNSTIGIASYDDDGVIGRQDWTDVGGGEAGYIAPDPRDPQVTYANDAAGYITRMDQRTRQAQTISVWPLDTTGHGAEDHPHRFQWTAPLVFSPNDPAVLYTGGERVFRSSDQGMTWTAISPDLTRDDKSRQKPSGGPITKDNTGVETYDTVFTIAESPREKGTIWAGTDDGLVQLTRDGGGRWENVTPRAMPEWSLVSLIEASPHDGAVAYAAIDRHRLDDQRPFVYRTGDHGKSWTLITAGLPQAPVHVVREDPVRKGLLFAGTEVGVYVSFDDGAGWQPLQLNLPRTPVHDLAIKDSDLVAATHGRAFWVLDDLAPLRQLERGAAPEVLLFSPRPAPRLHLSFNFDKRRPVGENPPPGAILDYYLKEEPKDEVVLEISDAQGKLVRRLSSQEDKKKVEQPPEWPDQQKPAEVIPAKAGMNRFAWNLRHESPTYTFAFYAGNGPEGPLALPGTYQVKLTALGKTATAPLQIVLDPRVKVSPEDLRKNFDLSARVADRVSALHAAINQIRDLRAQLSALRKLAGDAPAKKPLADAAADLDRRATAIEGRLLQINSKSSEGTLNYPTMLNEQFDGLGHSIDAADTAPAQSLYAVFDELSKALDVELAKWRELSTKEVPALNELARKSDLQMLSL